MVGIVPTASGAAEKELVSVDADYSTQTQVVKILRNYSDGTATVTGVEVVSGYSDFEDIYFREVNADSTLPGYGGKIACTPSASCVYVALKERPSDKTSSIIAQMPTTGTPEGLTPVGMVAIVPSMLGLGAGLARRRFI